MRGLFTLASLSSLWLLSSAVPVADPDAISSTIINGGVNSYLEKRAKDGLFSSDWCFDCNAITNKNWMSSIPDSTLLSKISIPGTHDTMTWAANLGIVGAQCQNYDLTTQLNSGIRYIDLRAWLLAGELQMSHGPALLGWKFSDAMTTIFNWLEANPTEGLIVRIREEEPPQLSGKTAFVDRFNYFLSGDGAFSTLFNKHLLKPSTPGSTTIPTLGALRGKMLILQGFGSDPCQYGIRWGASNFAIEDNYDAGPIGKLKSTKWPSIQDNLQKSLADNSGNTMYMTHLSASTSCPPIMAAAGLFVGPLIKYKGMNQLTGEWLASSAVNPNSGKNLGVVMMDFAGAKLINQILKFNAHLTGKK